MYTTQFPSTHAPSLLIGWRDGSASDDQDNALSPPWSPSPPPERAAADADPTKARSQVEQIGPGRDVLVVDDDLANLVAIEAALEPLGRKIVRARSGIEALSHLLQQDFALVLLDVQMPEMDGFETAQLMRSRERFRSTPIIFITGVTWPDDTDLRGYQLGAFDFLMKPIRPEVLRAKASVFIQLQESTWALQKKSEELRLEQQRAYEIELQSASALQFQTLANTLPLLAWYANPDGTVPWYNTRWYEYVGGSPGQLGSWNRSDLFDPEADGQIRAKWREALLSGEPWEDVFRIRRHDGERRWFLCRAVPLKDRKGRVLRWFGTNVDIDEQKLLEATAEAASRAKDEFLAMLGHELRNPLAPIQTALDLMEMRIPETAQRERSIIERQVKHLMRLVDDLLDVSRITQGKIELRRERVELSEIVARGVEMASPLLEKKAIRLTLDVAKGGLALQGDPSRMAQVIANVLNNAAKFTEDGGAVTVSGERDEADGDWLRVRITDTGIGMSAEILPRVFELFTQERQSVDRAQGGLGLGLSIARSIVEMHGGSIRAYSGGLGRGSELVLELPAAGEPAPLGARSRPRTSSGPLPRLRILVVDDNEDAAQMLAEVLGRSGYEVRFAHDGPAALSLLTGFTPDVAILDLGLPVMDGYELLAQLRRTPGMAELRFIAVTGYGQADDLRRTQEAGFLIHLVKPINLKQVREAIEQVREMELPVAPAG